MIEQEIWKDIPEYEGTHQVSNLGRVRSLSRFVRFDRKSGSGNVGFNHTGKVLKQWLSNSGYLRVKLAHIRPFLTVHRLVAQAFLTPDPDRLFVNHINCDKTDNRAVNLEWCNASENMTHAHRNGLVDTSAMALAKSKAVRGISLTQQNVVREYPSAKAAGQDGFNQGHVSQCAGGRERQHKGFRWEYL